ncbi:CDP-alcohol phosphatidyltransferase family protein [Clostridium magnum]|uniref:CDP-alcohol phosphatidyltransferase n=1 Tax=Clostridium magnum DSM 2767 TaxID=1121326 RepID=A0A162UJV7_9CLOT|nr:CDP-alcohol phosphatidyltransferase family protein [Clostridium magnum]KZL94004.1 CDP-alcohol phosphatidyltransferase [Clostridium magnum DSM 2767]SHI00211.1 CDP-diacylglycerol---serine O-phosphatidyltransferase [Clostridium magnum DSM 2767]
MLKTSIPNLLSLVNLSLGVLSIMETFNQNYLCASILIIISALIDIYNVRISKFLNLNSSLGKELDSLADLVSFGVAPALLIFIKYYFFNLEYVELLGTCLMLTYIMRGCYKLAKYNLDESTEKFTGVSITAAGCAIALFSLVTPNNNLFMFLSIVLVVLLSYLLESKLKIKKI